LLTSKAAGTAQPSVTASLLEDLPRRSDAPADENEVIRTMGAAAYAAGSDTVCNNIEVCSKLTIDADCFLPDQLYARYGSLLGGATEGSSRT
jgi:hypothetical protein